MRVVGVVTGSRSDYGIYLPLLRKIDEDPDLRLHLIVSGMHLSPEFGLTVKAIETDGFEVNSRVEMLLSSDTPEGISKSMGIGTMGYAQSYAHLSPDLLIVLGDRFEMHAAAVAALPFKIPVVHLHGGEITRGAIDDALRHSITKLSHLHFVSTEESARRIIQMGEESWRVTVSGALALDTLHSIRLMNSEELEADLGFRSDIRPLLVTFHPVTLEFENTRWYMEELLGALDQCDIPIVFTKPNADTGGRVLISMMEDFAAHRESAHVVTSLGTRAYFSMMAISAAMVGNSSSGLIEAPSFKLPVVNIGTRQDGRIRAANVIDVAYKRAEIFDGIRKALDPQFRSTLDGLVNPYGTGGAAEIIVDRIKTIPLEEALVTKRFADVEFLE